MTKPKHITEVPKALSGAEKIERARRLEVLANTPARCPKCWEANTQLVKVERPARWMCRECKRPFVYEPEGFGRKVAG